MGRPLRMHDGETMVPLQPRNLTQWRRLRHQVERRHEARREQYRFRKAPVEYLAALEEKLCQQTMRL